MPINNINTTAAAATCNGPQQQQLQVSMNAAHKEKRGNEWKATAAAAAEQKVNWLMPIAANVASYYVKRSGSNIFHRLVMQRQQQRQRQQLATTCCSCSNRTNSSSSSLASAALLLQFADPHDQPVAPSRSASPAHPLQLQQQLHIQLQQQIQLHLRLQMKDVHDARTNRISNSN